MQRKSSWKLAVCILAVILASVVFFQWKSFSTQSREYLQTADANISIKHKNNYFSIQQTIHQINPQTYDVILPDNAIGLKCTESSKKNCKWLDTNQSKLKLSNNSVTFTYKIKKEQGENDLLLLRNWFIQFKNLNMDKINIQLSESQFQNGSWISGGKNIAVKHLKFIDYYVFESKGKYPSLLWTNHKLLKVPANDWLTIYHEESVSLSEFDFNKINNWKNPYPVSIYITKDIPTKQIGASLIVLNKKDVSNLETMIVQSYLTDRFPDTKEWIRDIIATAITGTPVGSSKVKKMYNQLANFLNDNEMDKWTSDVMDIKKDQIQEKDLDTILQKVIGWRTFYFQENKHEEEPLKPLHFYDPHMVLIDGQVENSINIILLNGKRMYPLEKTLSTLGYTVMVSNNNSKIEIDRPNQKYIFDKNSHIFYFNNEKYGALSNPIIEINRQYFIEENWLRQLFKVNIAIRDKQIELTDSKQ